MSKKICTYWTVVSNIKYSTNDLVLLEIVDDPDTLSKLHLYMTNYEMLAR